VAATKIGVLQGFLISPLYSNIYLNLLDQLWHSRGYPTKLGATLHRYADDGAPRTHERRFNVEPLRNAVLCQR
jgi:retron-type reverse transcriptase